MSFCLYGVICNLIKGSRVRLCGHALRRMTGTFSSVEGERKVKSESDEAKSCVCVCSRTRDTVQKDGLLNDRSREGMEGGGSR